MTDGSGPKLSEHRKDAAAQVRADSLLDRPLPSEYREEWAKHFAEPEKTFGDEADEKRSVVLFRIGDEWMALATALFHEVAEPRAHHSIPHRRDNIVLGIVNVRGELVVCVSLRALLGLADAQAVAPGTRMKAFPRLLVIGRDGRRVAFPVDEVHGIHHYSERDVVAVPATIARSGASFTSSIIVWQGRTVGRLDERLVLESVDRSIA